MFQVGPFRNAVEKIHFLTHAQEPANLFMLAARNGKGKTTALECLVFLFAMLSERFQEQDWSNHTLLRSPGAQAQLDLFVTLTHGRFMESPCLISLCFGLDQTPQLFGTEPIDELDSPAGTGLEGLAEPLTVEALTDGRAHHHLRLGFVVNPATGRLELDILSRHTVEGRSGLSTEHGGDAELRGLIHALRAWVADAGEGSAASVPYSSFSPLARAELRPTLLYFTAHRDVVALPPRDARLCEPTLPEYQIVQTFGADGMEWSTSLSNLLVWYYWMNPGLYEDVRKYVNEVLFSDEPGKGLEREPHKRPPGIDVKTLTGSHLLEQLSSGERNLIQFFVRLAAHATRNTLILIDEVENHLHPSFQALLMQRLKSALRERRDWTVIFTSHSRDTIAAFNAFEVEPGIQKGGELLDPGRF